MGRAGWLVVGWCVACAPPQPALSPAEADRLHADCNHLKQTGRFRIHKSESVGFRKPTGPIGQPVVMYGADWCKACKIAAAYMKHHGIPFVEHDVEYEAGALDAMNETLSSAGLPVKTVLPVMDIEGTVTVGFDVCIVDTLAPASPKRSAVGVVRRSASR